MKKVLISIFIFLVVVVIGFFAGAKIILAHALEKAIGASVHISRVSLTPSQMGIYGLEVKNPKGYTEDVLARVPEISLKYDLKSFFSAVPHVRELNFHLDQITV